MLKKIFAWALVLAMLLTMMPMMDEHNHAHAAYIYGGCNFCSCSVWRPTASYAGSTVCECGCTEVRHIVSCDHANAQYYPNYGNEYYNTHERYCREKHCPETKKYVNENHIWVDGKCVCGVTQHTCTEFSVDRNSPIEHPTCNSYGGYTGICTECGNSQFVPFPAYDPTNHSWNNDGTCANGCGATCEHKAYADGECTECGLPHEHADTDWKKVEGSDVAATCVAPNTWTEKCVCGVTKTGKGAIDPDAHKWNTITGQCENTGCEHSCEHKYVNGNGICTECTLPCKHEKTHNVTTEAATCKNVGSADLICDECGEIADTVELPIDPDNHDWVVFPFGAGYCVRCNEVNVNYDDFEDVLPEKEPVENPCDEHQWASLAFGAWYCTKCGATATDIKELDPTICDHNEAYRYLEVIEAATCKKEGVAKEICDICDEVQNENVVLPIDPDAHDWTVFGFGAGWCNLCYTISTDDSLFEEPEDPKDNCEHDWVYVGIGWYCYKCNSATTEDPIPEEPEVPEEEEVCEKHQWASLAFGAWYCIKCGASATDIKPLEPEKCDHADTYIDVTTPATCKTPGVGNKMCDICETMMEEGVEVPVDTENGHKWVQDTYCELCGETKPAKPEDNCDHDWIYFSFGGLICKHCMKIALVNCEVGEHYTDNGKCAACGALKGDVIRDGNIDNRDVLKALQMKGGSPTWFADMNDDGTIDNRDVLAILRSK